jgi:signal-transduction protein with cAMP-binding, CBS, and nucleotidyltransferase domain
MPYPVKHLIEDHGIPVCVKKEDLVTRALTQMIEHDYSQLPIIDRDNHPLGMVTYEGILRGVRNFKTTLEEFHVKDVMTHAPIYNLEDDLFDLLDQLKLTNAVLIIDPGGELTGIVTSYDATAYFRDRTEDLMRVEEIEAGIKDFIRIAYSDKQGSIDEVKLTDAIAKTAFPDKTPDAKSKQFDDLPLENILTCCFIKTPGRY